MMSIQKIQVHDFVLELPALQSITINYTIQKNEKGKLKTGYFVLIDDGATTTHHHILAYADQSGEILKMKRLPSGVSDYLDKEIDGLYGEKIKIESPHSNEY